MNDVSLLEAVRANDLLGGTLPKLWARQVDLLESLQDPNIALHIWALGRGSSKTTLCALAAIFEAGVRGDLDGTLAGGRTRYVLCAAPGEEQSREFIRVCRGIIEASPVLRPMATISADRIDFTTASGAKTAIRSLPCKAETVRGMSASMCICDEFAHFGRTEGSSSATSMYEALDGSMVPFQDKATTVLISTPKGTSNLFAEKLRDVQGGVLPRARALQAATWDVRPDLTQEFLDRKRLELGEASFSQEYGAQFVDAGGSFFDTRDFEFIGDSPARPEEASRWTCSLDPAFHNDQFAVTFVGPSASEPGVLLVGRVETITPTGKLRAFTARRSREDRTLARVAQIIEPVAAVRPVSIVTDVHQSDAIRAYFGRLGYVVKVEAPSGKEKTAAFVSTRSRLVDRSLRCWRHPGLVEEMRRVRAKDTETVELPRVGSNHCDLIASLCQGVYQYRHHTGVPEGQVSGGRSMWAEVKGDLLGPEQDQKPGPLGSDIRTQGAHPPTRGSLSYRDLKF
jgi:hypothetical protein